MLQIRTLGGLALTRGGQVVSGSAAQRRRMAILLLLVHGGAAGVSRDRLLAWLWPESGESRARAALDQALYALRRELGPDALVETTALHVAPGIVTSDALAFEAAVAAGDDAAAVGLYGGPFLDGIHFSDAPELERWAADTRGRLASLHQGALARLAGAAEVGGRWQEAADWRRRALAADPLATGAAIGLARALARSGDRAAALRAAEVHATLVRQELGAEPDPRVRAAAEEDPADERLVAPASAPSSAPPASRSGAAPADLDIPPSAPPRGPWRRTALAVALASALAGVAAVGISLRAAATPRLEPGRVLLAPFENASADAAIAPLGRMAADWLSEGLQRTGLVQVVDLRAPGVDASASRTRGDDGLRALARTYGAGLLVRGSYYRIGDSVYLQARVEDVASGRVVRSVERTPGSLARPAEAVDRMRERTMAALASLVDPRLGAASQAATPPPTYAAYARFVRGIDAATANDFESAIRHFEQASHTDTSFILPQLWSALMWRMIRRCGSVDSVGALVAPRRDRLAPSDRLLLDRVLARCRGDHAGALAAMRRAAEIAPGPEVLFTLAVDAMEANRPREALAALARVSPTSGFLRDTDAHHTIAARSHHLLGQHREELAVARAARAAHPDFTRPILLEATALAALGQPDAAVRVAHDALRYPPQLRLAAGEVMAHTAFELAAHGEGAAARALARETVAWFARTDSTSRALPPSLLSVYDLAGRPDDAWRSATRAVAERPGDPVVLGALGVAAARRGDIVTARRADSLLRAPVAYSLGFPALARARIAAVLGEGERAVALLQESFADGLWYPDLPHSDPAFSRLRDTPAFRAVMQPRD
jgi:DNA-binding SARP family transcriptional activator